LIGCAKTRRGKKPFFVSKNPCLVKVGIEEIIRTKSIRKKSKINYSGVCGVGGGCLNPDTQLSIIKEAILPESEFQFSIAISDNKTEQTYDKYIRKFKKDISDLFDIINYFTLENLYQELDYIRPEIDAQADRELRDYYEFLEDRVKEIEDYRADKQNIALMRLGSGKTYYYNSMGLAFMLTYEKADYRFRQQFRLQPKQDLFPVTRTLTKDKMELGWVKIEKI